MRPRFLNRITSRRPHCRIDRGFPVLGTAVAWLLLDRFDASGLTWGIVMAFLVVLWADAIANFFFEG